MEPFAVGDDLAHLVGTLRQRPLQRLDVPTGNRDGPEGFAVDERHLVAGGLNRRGHRAQSPRSFVIESDKDDFHRITIR